MRPRTPDSHAGAQLADPHAGAPRDRLGSVQGRVLCLLSPQRAGARLFLLALALLASVAAPPHAPAAEPDVTHADVYVRRRFDVPGALQWIADEARRIQAGQVIVVLDAITFAPPAGLTEFTSEYAFCTDLPRWLDALDAWPKDDGIALRATSSLAPRTVPVGEPGWRADLEALVTRPWFEGAALQQFEPADRWMTRLLDRTEVVAGRRDARPRLVVLVAGHLTPERWIPADVTRGYESQWRTKLARLGTYWNDDAVATTLQRHAGRLYVIAPEARFGDFSPAPGLPDLPWVSRPMYPPEDLYGWLHAVLGGLAPGGAGRHVEADLRAELDRKLAALVPDPVERAKLIDSMLRGMPKESVTTPGPQPRRPHPVLLPPPETGKRFLATTPVWFLREGATRLWSNHAPSGYGHWPLARAAARTGGRYLFYPFPESPWLDPCPRDDTLLARLAPELVDRDRYVRLRAGDPALEAQCQAMARVLSPTPWADGIRIQAASGWSAFERASPLKLQRDWFLRRRPYDDALRDSEDGMLRLGQRLNDEVLPAYDQALSIVERALYDHASGQERRSHPRSVADLYLTRFGLAMSAFHLQAYAIYASEIERFIPPEMQGHVDAILVTYVPTIRLSDCLDAYDGRTLSAEDEARYPVWEPAGAPGYQGNLLRIPVESPDYRAKRTLDRVLLRLDGRLRRRALLMIEAARAVMERYARTGWGWTTYYSEAYTFIFKPAPVETGSRPTPGGSDGKPGRPTTPQGPGSTPGGSAPGGPATR